MEERQYIGFRRHNACQHVQDPHNPNRFRLVVPPKSIEIISQEGDHPEFIETIGAVTAKLLSGDGLKLTYLSDFDIYREEKIFRAGYHPDRPGHYLCFEAIPPNKILKVELGWANSGDKMVSAQSHEVVFKYGGSNYLINFDNENPLFV